MPIKMSHTGIYAEMACIWEVTARKPGNVHRERDFADVGVVDFLLSAAAIRPALEKAGVQRVGDTVLEAVRATRNVVGTNTNLGIVLSLAPLAAVPEDEDLAAGVERILGRLDVDDSCAVFEAIRLARPGGLGKVKEEDVHGEPARGLREVMALAADRDMVARQYANGFREVLDDGLPALVCGLETTHCLEGAIIFSHLSLLARHPDSLILRKRGRDEADEASRWARKVLDSGWPNAVGRGALAEFDGWLRAVGNGRNPGTSADLVTACLFAALRRRIITIPSQFPFRITD